MMIEITMEMMIEIILFYSFFSKLFKLINDTPNFFFIQTLNKEEYFTVSYTFFRGSKEQMMGRKMPEPSELTVTVTVVQEGKPEIVLQCPGEFKMPIFD